MSVLNRQKHLLVAVSTCLQLLVGVLSPAAPLLLGRRPTNLLRLCPNHRNGLLVVPVVVCSHRSPVNLLGLRRGVRLPQEEQRLRAGGRCHRVAAHHVILIVLIYRGCSEPLGRCAPHARKPRHAELFRRRPPRRSLSLVIATLSLLSLFLRRALRKSRAYCDQQYKQLHPAHEINLFKCQNSFGSPAVPGGTSAAW